MCAVEKEIESAAGMKLLGATAIEDKLQDGVPAALKNLLDGEIKVSNVLLHRFDVSLFSV